MCKCEDERQDECCSEGCCDGSCCSDGCCKSEEGIAEMLMKFSDEAWEDLMREKIKSAMEKKKGAKMDKIASIVVDAAAAYWEGKMQEKERWSEFEEQLDKAMKE